MGRLLVRVACAAAVTLAAAAPVQAAVVTFDDVGHRTVIQSGYSGLDWQNWGVVDPSKSSLANTGYEHGVVSAAQVAYSLYGDPTEIRALDGTFSFAGGYFTAGWRNDLTLKIEGFNSSGLAFSETIDLNTQSPFHLVTNWSGLTSLKFTGLASTPAEDDYHFIVDNLDVTVSAVPEPATWAMMIAGFGLVGGAMRGRRRQAAQAT